MKKVIYALFLLLLLVVPSYGQAVTVEDRLMKVTLNDTVYSEPTEVIIHVRVSNPSPNYDLRDVTLYLPDGQVVDIGYVGTDYTRFGDVAFFLSEKMLNEGKFVVSCSYRRCWAENGDLNEQGTFRVEIDVEKAKNGFDEWLKETGDKVGSFLGDIFWVVLLVGIFIAWVTDGDPDAILIIFRRK